MGAAWEFWYLGAGYFSLSLQACRQNVLPALDVSEAKQPCPSIDRVDVWHQQAGFTRPWRMDDIRSRFPEPQPAFVCGTARHPTTRRRPDLVAARINSFELAYRMQMAAPEALDLAGESMSMHKLYGTDRPECATFGRQCLMARKLVERGVRFVQIFAGKGVGGDGSVNDVPWDCHSDVETNHRSCGMYTDQPAAALLSDLQSRGLLESTLVIWGGEFGRTSDSQGDKGRDHNPNGFTIWMAGAGVRGGMHYGSTDPFGYKAVENKVHVNDLHATLLHLLGLDHTRLTHRFNGRDFRLTDVGGEVLRGILT